MEQVLLLFLGDPTRERYGLEISRQAALPRGTLYRSLMRMEDAGWLESAWEDIDPSVAGRPPRRLYRLTPAAESTPRTCARASRRRFATA